MYGSNTVLTVVQLQNILKVNSPRDYYTTALMIIIMSSFLKIITNGTTTLHSTQSNLNSCKLCSFQTSRTTYFITEVYGSLPLGLILKHAAVLLSLFPYYSMLLIITHSSAVCGTVLKGHVSCKYAWLIG